jgi:hypothetical protein
MNRLIATATAATILLGSFAQADAPQRIRGTITAATDTTLTLALPGGGTDTVTLAKTTLFVAASKASLADIAQDDFIGTATKTQGPNNIALEVVIFPPAMRGAGEGHYPWDNITDTTTPGATTHSSMTNGSVAMTMPPRKTASSMTNGNVQVATAAAGDKQLVVTYTGGQQTIMVPPSAPVVKLAPASFAAIQTGDSVFIVAEPAAGQLTALRVVIGTNGTKLAM